MQVQELEPFILEQRLEPKHVYLGRGGRIIWFVTIRRNDTGEVQIVLYDHNGDAYITEWGTYDDTFWDEPKIARRMEYTEVRINGIVARHNETLSYGSNN